MLNAISVIITFVWSDTHTYGCHQWYSCSLTRFAHVTDKDVCSAMSIFISVSMSLSIYPIMYADLVSIRHAAHVLLGLRSLNSLETSLLPVYLQCCITSLTSPGQLRLLSHMGLFGKFLKCLFGSIGVKKMKLNHYMEMKCLHFFFFSWGMSSRFCSCEAVCRRKRHWKLGRERWRKKLKWKISPAQ